MITATTLTLVTTCAILLNDRTKQERSLPVPVGLTHDEAAAWCTQWLATDERVNGFADYSF